MIRRPSLSRLLLARKEMVRLSVESGFAKHGSPDFAKLSEETAATFSKNLEAVPLVDESDATEILQTLADVDMLPEHRVHCVRKVHEASARAHELLKFNAHSARGQVAKQEMAQAENYVPEHLWEFLLDEAKPRNAKTTSLSHLFWALGLRKCAEATVKKVVILGFLGDELNCTVDAVLCEVRTFKNLHRSYGGAGGISLPVFDGQPANIKVNFPELYKAAYATSEPAGLPARVLPERVRNLEASSPCRSSKTGSRAPPSRGSPQAGLEGMERMHMQQQMQMQQMQFQMMLAGFGRQHTAADSECPIPNMLYTDPRRQPPAATKQAPPAAARQAPPAAAELAPPALAALPAATELAPPASAALPAAAELAPPASAALPALMPPPLGPSAAGPEVPPEPPADLERTQATLRGAAKEKRERAAEIGPQGPAAKRPAQAKAFS